MYGKYQHWWLFISLQNFNYMYYEGQSFFKVQPSHRNHGLTFWHFGTQYSIIEYELCVYSSMWIHYLTCSEVCALFIASLLSSISSAFERLRYFNEKMNRFIKRVSNITHSYLCHCHFRIQNISNPVVLNSSIIF